MNLPRKFLNLDVAKHLHGHLADKEFCNMGVGSDISILIGADNPMLHLYTDIRVGNENEPMALKTKLGWVIFGGHRNNNKYHSINAFSNEFDLGNMV